MYKLAIIFAVFAVASAGLAPTPLLIKTLGGETPADTERASHVAAIAPIAYAAPLTYAAHAPLAYAASPYAFAHPLAAHHLAPIAYTSGYHVAYKTEPIEQHGYKIAY